VRRRENNDEPGAMPLRLVRFDPDEWGGGPEAPQRWYDALDEWRDAGNEIMHPLWTVWPDVPFDESMI